MTRQQEAELEALIKAFSRRIATNKTFKANVDRVIKKTLPKR